MCRTTRWWSAIAHRGPECARIARWLDDRESDDDCWLEARREPNGLRLYTLAGDGRPELPRGEGLPVTPLQLNTLLTVWPTELQMPERSGVVVCGWLTHAPVWSAAPPIT